MRLTVGPLPPAVYWRRRAIVLGAALVVLFVVAQACMSGSPADDRAGDGDPSPSTSDSPPPDTNQPAGAPASSPPPATGQPTGAGDPPSEPPSAPPAGDFCTDDEIKLTALASETTFAVGAGAEFTMRIEHDADRPCERDVGGDQRELYLVPDAGSGRVWSSRDCADPAGEEVVRLTAGWEREHHITFRGSGGPTCTDVLEAGEYELLARLGSARSEPLQITLQ